MLPKIPLLAVAGLSVGLVTLSGCAHMFSSRHQKVAIQSATPGAKIHYPEEGVKTTKSGARKYDKMRAYHTVSFEKEGYKTTNYSFQLTKRSPTFALAILDLAVPLYGWFYGIPIDLWSPKTRKFDNKQTAPALIAYDKRKTDEKFLSVNTTAFDIKGKDITWHQYLSMTQYKDGKKKDSRSVRKFNKSGERDDIKVDNTIFTDALNGTIRRMSFIDTTNTIFPSASNTLYLNAKVKKITVHNVESRLGRKIKRRAANIFVNELMAMEMDIEWEVLDYYKQKVYSTNTKLKSDLYTYYASSKAGQFDKFVRSSMADNLEYSLLKIRKELAEKGLLKISDVKAPTLAAITIARPPKTENGRMNDFLKSVVSVKVDDGHGSGAVISADGYIITAYHVVAGSKKVEVIFNDGTKADAEVIRKNEEADLALIKVTKTGLIPIALSNSNEPEIGVDVWAIGTPKSIELGQSVSKGVLSAVRLANNVSYLQTDVSINGGNSGGPLISKDGMVLGIVTSKLIGIGTEGVGFAINADEIFKKLNIKYE